MNDIPSVGELQSMLQSVARTRPRITEKARSLLGRSADIINLIGLPVRQADWFFAEEQIDVFPEPNCLRSETNVGLIEISECVRIGKSRFGSIVMDCSTGHIVYVDETGATQLVNTSLERFLYFVGRFHQAAEIGFSDRSKLRRDFESVDQAPLQDPNGVWSVTIEEAEAGLY
jgi:hypothetical protein